MQTQVIEEYWEELFIHYFSSIHDNQGDASHDIGHFRRVYDTAKQIALMESSDVDLMVILAAAYFHDIVSLPKNHPENKMSSRFAAIKAQTILQQMDFPQEKIPAVCHAIETHSFSANLEPQTIEAKIIQDADRMEALGALGIMRMFYVSGRIGRAPFDAHDLYAKRRPLDDKAFGFDHFYVKLFKLPELLQTQGGRHFAGQRVEFLHDFINELESNIQQGDGGALFVTMACCQAGHQGTSLFEFQDPFASKRRLEPSHFVIDHLIVEKEKSEFISKFLDQLRKEINA